MADYLVNFFRGMRWQDVIDIALNSYILFRLYVLFRGTAVLRVMMAIVFMLFVQRLASVLGLIVTSWVIQGITAAAAFLIIVIFRNEIRTVLQAKNLKAILWGLPERSAQTPVESIADAVYEMSRQRTGALIVVPGKEDLEELIHSGIPWNGRLSKEMLLSIFYHGNPVHDGAAVIRGDRVEMVGAVLPLSNRTDLPSYYGTRHRAGIGLAEQSDALVIVVSEERGTVLIAKGTDIRVVKQKDEFIRLVNDHLGLYLEAGQRPRKERLELSIAGLISVILISAIWFSFTRGLETFTSLDVPIQYINRDPKMEIIDTSANAIKLNLSGPSSLIKSLKPSQIKVTIDLASAKEGQNTLSITPGNIEIPRGVHLRGIKPQVVEVTLDTLITKDLFVQVNWVGKLPRDMLISAVEVSPKTVKVVGPKHILSSITTVYTQPVRVDNIKKSGHLLTQLALSPPMLKLASESTDNITVHYITKRRE